VSFRGSRYVRQYESECRGKTLAWIDPVPVWVSAADWHFLSSPEKPCRRVFRLSLIGGGQIKVTENFECWPDSEGIRYQPEQTICYQPDLLVTAHVENVVHRYWGVLSHGSVYEMSTYAVVFNYAPQEIADRTAATLRAIDATPDNFYALLDASTHCAFCRRPLKDEVSKLVGVGPDCARQHGIPHSMKAASTRLALRQKLLRQNGDNP
jgi:hypothetical protein